MLISAIYQIAQVVTETMKLIWSLGAVAVPSHDRPFDILPYWRAAGIYRPPAQLSDVVQEAYRPDAPTR